MKKIKTFILAVAFFVPFTIYGQNNPDFYLAENDVTIMCTDAQVGDTGTVNDVTYTKREVNEITSSNAETTCTSGINNMSVLGSIFTADISHWDVSEVTSMFQMFKDQPNMNSDLSHWDVSNVTNMADMFYRATSFNSDLSSWNVSNVTSMIGMFEQASSFNGDLSEWDVSSVSSMGFMFSRATSFNSDLSEWDVSNVAHMSYMFNAAESFNKYIGNWNVSKVTNMNNMFRDATAFDQNLGSWDVSSVDNFFRFMYQAGLSVPNYDALLTGWSELSLVQDLTFDAGNSMYSEEAESARAYN